MFYVVLVFKEIISELPAYLAANERKVTFPRNSAVPGNIIAVKYLVYISKTNICGFIQYKIPFV